MRRQVQMNRLLPCCLKEEISISSSLHPLLSPFFFPYSVLRLPSSSYALFFHSFNQNMYVKYIKVSSCYFFSLWLTFYIRSIRCASWSSEYSEIGALVSHPRRHSLTHSQREEIILLSYWIRLTLSSFLFAPVTLASPLHSTKHLPGLSKVKCKRFFFFFFLLSFYYDKSHHLKQSKCSFFSFLFSLSFFLLPHVAYLLWLHMQHAVAL